MNVSFAIWYDSGFTSIFVNYTSSPEAKYPSAINEVYVATKWVAAHGDEINVDGKHLAVVGNSAGSNMAAVTALKTQTRRRPRVQGPDPVLAGDGRRSREIVLQRIRGRLFPRPKHDGMVLDNYVPDVAQRREVYASPLQSSIEQLQGLPPAHIQVAANVLRDDGLAYARKLDSAGWR